MRITQFGCGPAASDPETLCTECGRPAAQPLNWGASNVKQGIGCIATIHDSVSYAYGVRKTRIESAKARRVVRPSGE
jgi:hypothetical protein